MEKIKKNSTKLVFLILLIICFSASIAPKAFENDTFFTIAGGRQILEHGIQKIDTLTWHEGLEFTNDRWIFDILITLIYNNYDFFGVYSFVIIMSIIIGITLFYVLIKNNTNSILAFFITIITMYFGRGILAARSQIISIWLFILEIYFIQKLLQTNEKRYGILLVLVSVLIANIHASIFPVYFVFYLPYFAEYILTKIPFIKDKKGRLTIENKKNIKTLFIVFVLAILSGLCTPLGLAPYTSMIKASAGISSSIIAELQPLVCINEIGFMSFIIVAIAILIFSKSKVHITDTLFLLGLAIMALSTYRTLYYFIFIGSICLAKMIDEFLKYNNIYEYKFSKKSKIIFIILISVIVILVSAENITLKLKENYVDLRMFPVEVCEYILENIQIEEMKIYNGFNFGSYLEFKGIKSFIDSRSGMFSKEFNDTEILEDFNKVSSGTIHYNEIFDKYNITHALLETTEIANIYIQNDSNWKLLYKSDIFALYERVDN